ncbi:MAG: hypothetical protein JWP88_1612 [Flaviaesturariibacter sp.]|nr:hypothetical protein [Flaviaesturariibacter sp.]
MGNILITGGTGMIGTAITKALLAKGHTISILSRRLPKAQASKGLLYAEWNPAAGTIDPAAIQSADAIIHLAGANVADGRWTNKRKQEIVDSRVQSGQLLVKALKEIPNHVKTIVSASAIGWYGPDDIPIKPFVETDPPDNSFLGNTCQQWEMAIDPVHSLGKRLVTFRIGIVLSHEGGAYAEFRKPLNFGLATVLGSGRQVISWIQIDDLVRLFIEAVENEALSGIYNAVADSPVTNKELIKEMVKVKGGPHLTAPVPSFALKLALGEMSVEILKSATVSNGKIKAAGFTFHYPDIKKAVRELEGK